MPLQRTERADVCGREHAAAVDGEAGRALHVRVEARRLAGPHRAQDIGRLAAAARAAGGGGRRKIGGVLHAPVGHVARGGLGTLQVVLAARALRRARAVQH
eukprot:2703230-Prymnesium_polylepis.1